MSITLGIYDVFSYAIPGLLYLFTLNQFARLFGVSYIDVSQLDSALYLIPLGLLAYLAGHLFTSICEHVWYRPLYRGSSCERAYANLTRYDVQPDFKPNQWPVLLSVIRHDDMEIGNYIDKNKATSIMLRNVSFALILLAIALVLSAFIPSFAWPYLLGAVGALIGSVVALRRSDAFNQWFYQSIYQQAMVYGNSLKDVLESSRSRPAQSEQPARKPEEGA